ncbi:cadmium/zinc-transporting ATPase HMA1 chloroplastic [Tripterygium wilfordii]|uniref:Cadmium/zinc-transporting ATPase HMA1 chloroplastic n=1 Tax=Tripterygium wilfordii TaxID=458696 RepID=A0A7J7CQA5_TRIWF|nr:cadmium/zinc-transporting ATPase HMA1 chloroplastic [Tripterygium wilfordii]
MQLTEEAQMNKPKIQRWLDEFGGHYSKVVVALSVGIAFLVGPILFEWPFFSNLGKMNKRTSFLCKKGTSHLNIFLLSCRVFFRHIKKKKKKQNITKQNSFIYLRHHLYMNEFVLVPPNVAYFV